ncbi:S8 family serine peptidase [Tenacibaculum piscium]|uniref:Peptidase S8 n=3 Tax=Tenacibaculum piscium TaxID=1458515 RepID=A0A2H1YKB3_9FLAO|nr:S8 family serine peptidase [Tenacibaculum piscium]MBE7629255.1 S8 family serine peptidase [Tenacibaculum piscium]MBE7670042.1 S8 family serine peptidase [Tenacibaculum piscium]MBE7685533.1 S8 family serine peptidase [Tenacibaculum piscium]MBE7690117.1 S8 family serine peptidase [Tenacibaculum piscium]MCG8183298.1 S8 family serine peptidase [Tenacibaculum piscium]
MRVLKPMFYSAVAISILTSCSSVSKIAVPTGSNTVVNISAKKAELTTYQKDNWQHLDLATDSIPGMSVDKAYSFLKGKKNAAVIVAVVDTGTDLKHEDLADVAWVNTKEIPANGIDDDKNGYVDDIHGWNFLGKSYKEHLEYERILRNPSLVDAATLSEVKAVQETKVDAAKKTKDRYAKLVTACADADKNLTKYFGKSDYTKEAVAALNTSDVNLNKAKALASNMLGYFADFKEAKEYFENGIIKAQGVIAGDNLKTDYRAVVGDNPYDIKDKPGYGDANTGHSKKGEAHGSHVSGIIGATRNNQIGMNGVADNVKMMAVRSVSDGDEYDKDVALGIRYAVDNGAKVINTSFGKDFSPNKEWVYDAIKYAAKKDVLIVNAAGNDGKNIDVEKTFPNDAPDLVNEIADNVLTLGAMSANYNKNLPASFSNYGKINVDVFAPGVNVHSTTPDGEYKKFSGTSMAAPSAAGVAALVRSYYPELSASQVKHILMNSGTKIDLLVTKPGSQTRENPMGDLVPFADLSVSGRVVNAYNAVRMADRMVNGRK